MPLLYVDPAKATLEEARKSFITDRDILIDELKGTVPDGLINQFNRACGRIYTEQTTKLITDSKISEIIRNGSNQFADNVDVLCAARDHILDYMKHISRVPNNNQNERKEAITSFVNACTNELNDISVENYKGLLTIQEARRNCSGTTNENTPTPSRH